MHVHKYIDNFTFGLKTSSETYFLPCPEVTTFTQECVFSLLLLFLILCLLMPQESLVSFPLCLLFSCQDWQLSLSSLRFTELQICGTDEEGGYREKIILQHSFTVLHTNVCQAHKDGMPHYLVLLLQYIREVRSSSF